MPWQDDTEVSINSVPTDVPTVHTVPIFSQVLYIKSSTSNANGDLGIYIVRATR